jgi:hypothetical protein
MISKAQQELKGNDVTSLCNAAKARWDKATNSTRKVMFTWRGKRYQSRLTTFRMLVETPKSQPVAARYL